MDNVRRCHGYRGSSLVGIQSYGNTVDGCVNCKSYAQLRRAGIRGFNADDYVMVVAMVNRQFNHACNCAN
jgi:hypothetical protein